jgi:putative hydrolase of HD superfamily
MEPMDPADTRQPNVKVAASIRAAILNGELKPGERLPSGPELATFFGVARMTVQGAIRTLADEGFVRTKGGSGVFVREQANLPGPEEAEHPLAGTAAFLFEMGYLKTMPRSGWLRLGMKTPESVAEHSFRVTIIGMALAALEHADPNRTAALCVFHDAHETRIGDVPAPARAYVTTARPEAITAGQVSGLTDDMSKLFQDLTGEYEATETPESRVAHDADKIETLLQAVEYGQQGYDTSAWKKTSIEALRTESGKQLAQAVNTADPEAWWAAFAASYHELRASARGRARGLEPRASDPPDREAGE